MLGDKNIDHNPTIIEIMERPDFSAGEKLVLIELLIRESESERDGNVIKRGYAAAPVDQIAHHTSLSREGVKKALKKLDSKGVIDKISSKGRYPTRRRVNLKAGKLKGQAKLAGQESQKSSSILNAVAADHEASKKS